MKCPGCIRMCANIPRKPSSVYAAEGSAAHHLAEMCLIHGFIPQNQLGKKILYHRGNCTMWADEVKKPNGPHHIFEVDQEMADAVEVYCQEVAQTCRAMVGASFGIEERLDLSWLIPGVFGTGDHVAREPLSRVVVNDLKYGKGVAVEVANNPQLMIYGLAALGEGNPNMVDEVEMVISQPRAFHPDGRVRRHVMLADDLMEWGQEILKPAALATQKPDAPLAPGDWCRWCDVNDPNVCPAVSQQLLEAAEVVFDEAIMPVNPGAPLREARALTGEQLDRILQSLYVLTPWAEATKKEAVERLKTGHSEAPKLFKRIQGRGTRKWSNPEQAVADITSLFGVEHAYQPSKIATPAQVEKSAKGTGLKPKQIQEMITPLVETTYGEQLAPISNKKPALPAAADVVFGDVEL